MGVDSGSLRGWAFGRSPAQVPHVSTLRSRKRRRPTCALVAELDQAFLELGHQRRQRALDIWKWCLKENKWPGWPNGTTVLEAPPWHENSEIERRDAEQDAIDAGSDLLLASGRLEVG